MICARRSEVNDSLTKDISDMEIRKAITCQKDNNATGNDSIPTGISKQNIRERPAVRFRCFEGASAIRSYFLRARKARPAKKRKRR